MSVGFAAAPPRAISRWPLSALIFAAVLSILTWLGVEVLITARLHPRLYEMLIAARTVQAASRAVVAEKLARGLMQPKTIDPNRTGLIGSEITAITTTVGDLGSKRTVTNPDFAAALVRMIDTLRLPRGTPVVLVVSGSFVGADVAALAAVEALGLRPILVASLGASMFGATDPEFNLLDMLGMLQRDGVLQTRVKVAVLGGEQGVAGGMDPKAITLLRDSAAREDVPLVDQGSLPELVDHLLSHIETTGSKIGLVINVGGAIVALGSCPESYIFPPGLSARPTPCTKGTPGLVMRLSYSGIPALHVINLRRLAIEMGIPFDPIPLPQPGFNRAVYGFNSSIKNETKEGDIK